MTASWWRTGVTTLAGLTLLAVLACLWGCSRDSLVDERNIYYIRGTKLREEKKHEEAVKAFETCLRLSPQSAQAHLQLALIYDETLDDPLVAVYHYRCFLDMRPDDANVEAVRGWLQKAEQKLLQRLQQAAVYAAINQGAASPQLPESSGPAARELALLARVQELTTENEELRERAREPVIDPTVLAPPPGPAATGPGAPAAAAPPAAVPAVPVAPSAAMPPSAPGPAAETRPGAAPAPAAPGAPAAAGRVRYHVVGAGDTLSNLSRRYYGDVGRWPQLRQANRDLLGDKTELRLGMKLRIPPADQLPAAPAAAPRKSR
jgi:nucleoid-associated protein YgaU